MMLVIKIMNPLLNVRVMPFNRPCRSIWINCKINLDVLEWHQNCFTKDIITMWMIMTLIMSMIQKQNHVLNQSLSNHLWMCQYCFIKCMIKIKMTMMLLVSKILTKSSLVSVSNMSFSIGSESCNNSHS